MNSDSGHGAKSWYFPPEYAFTQNQKLRSRSARIPGHAGPEYAMIPGRLTEQLNKGFFVVNHARHAFLHKKGTRTLRVKSHGSAVAGLREEQAFTPGPHDMMQRPEPVKRAHR